MKYIQTTEEGYIDHSTYGKSNSPSIATLKQFGFNPIAITTMLFEETFVFETEEEALRAHDEFEHHPKHGIVIQGWWYDRIGFQKALEDYGLKFKTIHAIYWIYDTKRYSNGEIITKERIEDEDWYYSSYQLFLEFMMSFYKRRDITVCEIFEGYKRFLKETFNEEIKNEEQILRWAVLHCERHNAMPSVEELEEEFSKIKKDES